MTGGVAGENDVTDEAARLLFAGPCQFVWGAQSIDGLPPGSLPEVAFVGRSNVGKSSLVNALTGRKTLARVSQTPGRTRQINFFDLGGRLMLVDLPGYGYAKASKTLAMEWQRLILAYLSGRAALRRVALLVDARRGVGASDRAVMELLDRAAVSYALVLTKSDAVTEVEMDGARRDAGAEAATRMAALAEIFATSSLRGTGLDALKRHVAALAAPERGRQGGGKTNPSRV